MCLLTLLAMLSPLVINEICYDPDGPDGGAEFVELLNPGPQAVGLAGVRLEFANGAEAPAWQTRWTGGAADSLAAGARFLVAASGWEGPPAQAEVALGLQNGPDALRLVRADGSTDVVGWGDLAWPELSEGTPAVDVTGLALARRPDGQDTQDNARDFQPAEPTPGAVNWPRFGPRLAGWSWQPPTLAAAGGMLTASIALVNAGCEDLAGCQGRLAVGSADTVFLLPPLAPDQETRLALTVSPSAAGSLPAALEIVAVQPPDTVRFGLGHVQVGLGDIRLSEVMAAPRAGGEWLEIINAGTVPRSLAELVVRDEDGSWRNLPDLVLAPGDCRLVAQDALALESWLAECAATGAPRTCEPQPVIALPGWPSLNNTAPAGRAFADRLYLATADTSVVDHVTIGLGDGRAPAGRSLERGADLRWRAATAPAGATPGCPPPAEPLAAAGSFRIFPNPFSRREADGTLHLRLGVPTEAAGWELRIFDLWGRLVRDLGGDDLGPGARDLSWDGADESGDPLPAAGYVAVLHWRLAGGGRVAAGRRLLVLREGRP